MFSCDPNDINTSTYKQVQELCIQNKLEWKNQTYAGFITQFKNDFFNALNGRIKLSKGEWQELAKESIFKCALCKCCVKEV